MGGWWSFWAGEFGAFSLRCGEAEAGAPGGDTVTAQLLMNMFIGGNLFGLTKCPFIFPGCVSFVAFCSLVDPIPSSHFRLEQATLSQLVLVKRELRRVGLLQLLRAEEAALLKGLIKSMRERHATLRKRLASAAQQKAVGMLSDALAQCERYHVDFEDELEDAVVLCANLSADVASGEGVEDRGITKYGLQSQTCFEKCTVCLQ